MEFSSVERIIELLHLDQEDPGTIDPPAWWPTSGGDICFENVTIRYAPHLDPALSDVSLTIKGGSNTAIIGRTGELWPFHDYSLLLTLYRLWQEYPRALTPSHKYVPDVHLQLHALILVQCPQNPAASPSKALTYPPSTKTLCAAVW